MVTLNVEEGTAGNQVAYKGKGVPRLNGYGRGDFYVVRSRDPKNIKTKATSRRISKFIRRKLGYFRVFFFKFSIVLIWSANIFVPIGDQCESS